MDDRLRERLAAAEALFERPGTDGEREAAFHAINRLRDRLGLDPKVWEWEGGPTGCRGDDGLSFQQVRMSLLWEELARQCVLRPGAPRDWEALGRAIWAWDEARGYFEASRLVEWPIPELAWSRLHIFQRFLLLTGHHPSGWADGGPRTIVREAGAVVFKVKVPTSKGYTYDQHRTDLCVELMDLHLMAGGHLNWAVPDGKRLRLGGKPAYAVLQ